MESSSQPVSPDKSFSPSLASHEVLVTVSRTDRHHYWIWFWFWQEGIKSFHSKNREARRTCCCGPHDPRNSTSILSLAEQPEFNGKEKCSLEFVSEVVAFCLFCFSSASSQLTTFSCLSLKRDFVSFEPKEVSVCFHPVTSQYLILKEKTEPGLSHVLCGRMSCPVKGPWTITREKDLAKQVTYPS